jgi:hypothetical protein
MHNKSKHTNRREARSPQLKSRSGKIRGATRVHANITIAIHSDAILSHMVVLSTLFDTYLHTPAHAGEERTHPHIMSSK